MQVTQVQVEVEERAESREKEITVQVSALKSRFNDEEYERWSQSLRNKAQSKGK